MKLTPTVFLGSFGALAATLALAQESPLRPVDLSGPGLPGDTQTGNGGAVPLRPLLEPGAAQDPAEGPSQAAPMDSVEIAERLTVHDLDAREKAFDEIARMAAMDSQVRREVQALADDTLDIDLAFTARLVLREAERFVPRGRARSGSGGRGLQNPSDPFESMRQQVESVFGSDPFVDEFFSGDPFFSRGFSGRGGVFGVDPFSGGRDPFEAMQRRAEELRKQFDELHDRARQQQQRGGGNVQRDSSFSQKSSSMSMSSTPDGVRVEITEDDGSGPKTQVFQAPTLEALLEAHPELKGRF